MDSSTLCKHRRMKSVIIALILLAGKHNTLALFRIEK